MVITGGATPEDLLEDQLVENCLREDLRPIEQARAFRALPTSRGLTQRQLADRLQVGQGTISRALALLGLPGEIQSAVDAGDIGPGAAYQLTKVGDPAGQASLAREAAPGREGVEVAGSLELPCVPQGGRVHGDGREPARPRRRDDLGGAP